MMRRKGFVFFVFFVFAVFSADGTSARAQNADGVNAAACIEGCDRRLAEGVVRAYTFEDALKALSGKNNINVVFSNDGKKTRVYAVDGYAENTFGQSDGWFGYVLRGGVVIKPGDYLSFPLEDGDELVLYYGDARTTQIISSFTLAADGDRVTFTAHTEQSRWTREDGNWTRENVVEGVRDLIIRVRQPNGNMKILKTNEDGVAGTVFGSLGVYEYFAEGYVSGACPAVVRTNDQLYLHGVADAARVTRGEAVAFIVNHFSLPSAGDAPRFTDVNAMTKNATEITRGASAGLVAGFGDGRFMPDEPVTLLQFSMMLAGLSVEGASEGYAPADVPDWAAERMSRVLATGLLDGVFKAWYGPVTEDILLRVYLNARNGSI